MKPLAVPPGAEAVFGDSLDAVSLFGGWLAGPGVERGLLGPQEAQRLWQRHLMNSAALAGPLEQALPRADPAEHATGQVCDLGSGAGLPGIVVALLRPDLEVILLEPLLRRTRFLSAVVHALQLPRVSVVRGRAEEVAGSVAVDVVVARAVAPLERLARWSVPLLRPGGQLLALKGDRAPAELVAAAPVLDGLGITLREVLSVEAGGEPTQVVRLVRSEREASGWGEAAPGDLALRPAGPPVGGDEGPGARRTGSPRHPGGSRHVGAG